MSQSLRVVGLAAAVAAWVAWPLSAAQQSSVESTERADVARVEVRDSERHVLPSAHVGEDLKIHVVLPRFYPEEGRRYPVIYLLDSEYSFGCVAYVVRRLVKGGEMPRQGLRFVFSKASS